MKKNKIKLIALIITVFLFTGILASAVCVESKYVVTKIHFTHNLQELKNVQITPTQCSKEAYQNLACCDENYKNLYCPPNIKKNYCTSKFYTNYEHFLDRLQDKFHINCNSEECYKLIADYAENNFNKFINNEKKCIYQPSFIRKGDKCFDDYCYAIENYDYGRSNSYYEVDSPSDLNLLIYLEKFNKVIFKKIKTSTYNLKSERIDFGDDCTLDGNDYYFNPIIYNLNIDSNENITISTKEINNIQQLITEFKKDIKSTIKTEHKLFIVLFYFLLASIFFIIIFTIKNKLQKHKSKNK